MTTAKYVADLPGWVPDTRLYRLDDDRYLAVSVIDYYTATGTEVFLCDERGQPIDADGNPANGLTPLATFPPGTSHADALTQLGYQVTVETDA